MTERHEKVPGYPIHTYQNEWNGSLASKLIRSNKKLIIPREEPAEGRVGQRNTVGDGETREFEDVW